LEAAGPAPVGLPRPFDDYTPLPRSEWAEFPHRRLPVPWVSWSEVKIGNWTGFDDDAMQTLERSDYNVCGICGLALGDYKVFGRYPKAGHTTGPGMHAACALLSYHYCPYLIKEKEDEAFEIAHTPESGLDFEDAKSASDRYEALSNIKTKDAVAISMAELHELARVERAAGALGAAGADGVIAETCPVDAGNDIKTAPAVCPVAHK
jgi:hypothetical protein